MPSNPSEIKAKVTATALLLALITGCGWAIDPPAEATSYVVIGAFSKQENAIHFVESAKKGRLEAHFELNANRQLYYVFVLETADKARAIEEAKKLRIASPYNDTWVYTGRLGIQTRQLAGEDTHPVTELPTQPVVTDAPTTTEEQSLDETALAASAQNEHEGNLNGKAFYFKVFRSSNGKPLAGDVSMIDADKKRKSATYQSNKIVRIPEINESGNLALQCEVFGYRKIMHTINYQQPEATDGVMVEDGKITVPFELVRLRKGDYAVMYNVYFFKDAAIMRPESKYEVDALVEMMQENPNYKIRIHGHTNGKAAGKIISMGEKQNFFSLTGSKEGFGSAKKLSEERASTIRDFLVSQGVPESRLQVKAWGGKKPVYEKNHAQAHANVRVEIEIVEE